MKNYEDLVKLLKKVQATGGIDTDMDSICDYQDMIGHSSEEQLSELANGDYTRAFYRVYNLAYGPIETINFYMHHSDKVIALIEERDQLLCDLENEKLKSEKWMNTSETHRKNSEKVTNELNELQGKLYIIEEEKDEIIKSQAAEITELKAKLYDLMTK